jgi:hypothetical protein
MCRAECSLSALENEAQVQGGFDHSIDGRILQNRAPGFDK